MDGKGGIQKKGTATSKAKIRTSTLAKLQFDMVPRAPSNTGNAEDDLVSRQSFTSALTPGQKKRRENGSVSSATSSLTGSNTVDMAALTNRVVEDPGFRDMLQALLQVKSLKDSRGGAKLVPIQGLMGYPQRIGRGGMRFYRQIF